MKRITVDGVVSEFIAAADDSAVDFDEAQELAIQAAHAEGGAALWDGKALSFALGDEATEVKAGFAKAWVSDERFHAAAKATAQADKTEANARRKIMDSAGRG